VVRDPDEEHRASSPLVLFVDRCFVVAVAQASGGLHHELVAGHQTPKNAHQEADDAAADQWLHVARRFPELRVRCLRYALGITVVQLLWLLIIVAPTEWVPWLFLVLASGELAVPVWAERGARGGRYWRLFHPEHTEERYGLFTIIVLGESVLSATVGIQELATEGISAALVAVAVCGRVVAFGAWWTYFDHPDHLAPTPKLAVRRGIMHDRVRRPCRPRRRPARRRRGCRRRSRGAHRIAGRGDPDRRLPHRPRAADGRHGTRPRRGARRPQARRRRAGRRRHGRLGLADDGGGGDPDGRAGHADGRRRPPAERRSERTRKGEMLPIACNEMMLPPMAAVHPRPSLRARLADPERQKFFVVYLCGTMLGLVIALATVFVITP
jgi:hypothetical protein